MEEELQVEMLGKGETIEEYNFSKISLYKIQIIYFSYKNHFLKYNLKGDFFNEKRQKIKYKKKHIIKNMGITFSNIFFKQ